MSFKTVLERMGRTVPEPGFARPALDPGEDLRVPWVLRADFVALRREAVYPSGGVSRRTCPGRMR